MKNSNALHTDLKRVIVSLTSIKAREAALQETVTSLVKQDFEGFYEVRIYLSHDAYLLDDGFSSQPDWVSDLVKTNPYCALSVRFVRNTGPYRKLLPILDECFDDPFGTVIVTCDDDTRYSTSWLKTLLSYHRHTGGLVAFRGHTVKISSEKKTLLPYTEWQLNPDKRHFCLANLPTGKDGVVYRPSYFSPAVLDVEQAMRVAPTADDLWFRWHSIIRGVPCYLISLEDRIFDNATFFDSQISLWNAYNKVGGNDQTVAALEKYFNSTFGKGITSVLTEYGQYLNQKKPHPVSLRTWTPALLASRQVYINEALEDTTLSSRAVTSRSYELFRLQSPKNTTPSMLSSFFEPVKDRGGMAYAIEKVEVFDQSYGWMSHHEPNTSPPLVSVIMTTFNAEKTIRWAVSSVLAQDHYNLELVIVDDVSTDNTKSILMQLQREDRRIRLIFLKKNRGTYFAKNVGLRKAQGEVVTFQDADDWSHPARIRLQLWRLFQSGRIATRCNYVRHHMSLNQLVKVNGRIESPGFITLMCRRDLFEHSGYFDCSRRAADDELICRLKTLHGEDAVDTFALPAYVALYSNQSLIADSSNYSTTQGIQFSLSTEREHYKQSYLAWHAQLKANPRLLAHYHFPPRNIFIEKVKELRAFEENELCDLNAEVEVEEFFI
nr:glycosyltransferase [Pseudomonas luteola]